MPDRFEHHAASLDAPAAHGFAITPNDASELADVTRALYIGTPGHVSLVMLSGASVTMSNLAGGTVLPLRVRQVRATGTTAGSIVGLL